MNLILHERSSGQAMVVNWDNVESAHRREDGEWTVLYMVGQGMTEGMDIEEVQESFEKIVTAVGAVAV